MASFLSRRGGSTFSFMWNGTALEAMREMQTLGLGEFDVIMAPGHLWHDELTTRDRSLLASTMRAEGLQLESLNLPALDQNIASCVPEARAYAVNLYTSVIELCAELGGKAVVVVPGRVSGLFPPPPQVSDDLLADSLERLLVVAERSGQDIYIESHPQTPIATVDRITSFLEQLPHPLLKVAYDVSNAEFVAEDQAAAIRRLGARIGQVHLSDGTRTQWRHDRVGLGTVDFLAVRDALEDIGFAGVSVLEIISADPLEDIRASSIALSALSKARQS